MGGLYRATVIVTDLNPQGRAVADDLGDNARFILLDATDEAAWDAVLDEVLQHYGRLDILVNNAGGSAGAGPFESYTLDMHRREIDLNLTSTWLGSRCALRAMREGGGSIVNISSMDGLAGIAGMASYVAAKFGVTGLTRTLALELGDRGIRVNSVHPGFIATPLVKGASDVVKERLHKAIGQKSLPQRCSLRLMNRASAPARPCWSMAGIWPGHGAKWFRCRFSSAATRSACPAKRLTRE